MARVDLKLLTLAIAAGIVTVLVFVLVDILVFGPGPGALGAGIAGGVAGVIGSAWVNRRRFFRDS